MKSAGLFSQILCVLGLLFLSSLASAARGGGGGASSLEFGIGIATASQDDINNWATANSGQQLSSGYEFTFSYLYRFSGSMFALALRPGYFSQSNSGSATASLSGITFMPMLRLYPLENSFIRFFMQIGLGGGALNGTLSVASGNTSFSGGAFGAQAGLGADFCFTDSHCMTIEGNFRYMPIPRSVISSTSGNLGSGSMTTASELEKNGIDAQNTLTGIQGILAYTLKF